MKCFQERNIHLTACGTGKRTTGDFSNSFAIHAEIYKIITLKQSLKRNILVFVLNLKFQVEEPVFRY